MILKGIASGDGSYRHFTFDDEDVICKDGEYFYKVKYEKNSLEGDYAEDEIGYVACDKVMCIGGKKPKPIVKKEQQSQNKQSSKVEQVKTVQKKKGRPSKKTVETVPYTGSDTYEYVVREIHSCDVEELQAKLNEAGLQGWELCGFDSNKSLFGEIQIIVILKRKRG